MVTGTLFTIGMVGFELAVRVFVIGLLICMIASYVLSAKTAAVIATLAGKFLGFILSE